MKNMPIKIGFILILFFASGHLRAQGYRSSAWYDSITYSAYLKADWKTVLETGKEAVSKGIDYYYLRMRLAEAYFNQGKYRKALTEYDKAGKFNSTDPFLHEMRYYSLENLGDRDRAYKLSSAFSAEQMQKLKPAKPGIIDMVYAETGFSSDAGIPLSAGALAGPDSVYGEREAENRMIYYHAGGRFRVSPTVAVYAGFTGLSLEKERQFEYYTTEAQRDSVTETIYGKGYYYSFYPLNHDTGFSVNLRQNGLYLNATILASDHFTITPAVHLLNISSGNVTVNYSPVTRTDTAYFLNADNSWHTFTYPAEQYLFEPGRSRFRNSVISLDVSFDKNEFVINAFGSRSDLNAAIQYQAGAGVCWYPLGNNNLYGSVMATFVNGDAGSRMVYEPSLGGRIIRNAWLTAFLTFGNLDLYNEKNGYILYNQPDPVTFRAGADLLYSINPHLDLSLMYRFLQKENSMYRSVLVTLGSGPAFQLSPVITTYNNQSFFGGIKWKF